MKGLFSTHIAWTFPAEPRVTEGLPFLYHSFIVKGLFISGINRNAPQRASGVTLQQKVWRTERTENTNCPCVNQSQPLDPFTFKKKSNREGVSYHVKAEQGPHVSVVKLQCLRKILPGQLEVFQTSLGVLYLGVMEEETERWCCVIGTLKVDTRAK